LQNTSLRINQGLQRYNGAHPIHGTDPFYPSALTGNVRFCDASDRLSKMTTQLEPISISSALKSEMKFKGLKFFDSLTLDYHVSLPLN